jgi:hypothetical protein
MATLYSARVYIQQDTQYTHKLPLRHVRVTIVVVEK